MADVFLSYARNDRALVEPIKDQLEALGLSVFFDLDGIEVGDTFPERIGNAVVEAKIVFACWTPHALTRPWCRRECYLAQELEKLVPAALAPLATKDLREFSSSSYADLRDFDGRSAHMGWSQALAAIAIKLDDWALENNDDQTRDATALLAARVRQAARRARPAAEAATAANPSAAAATWAGVDQNDPGDLENFAATFPGTPEAFLARRRISGLSKAAGAYAALDRDDPASLEAFLGKWAEHPKAGEVAQRLAALREAQEARAVQEAQEARRAEREARAASPPSAKETEARPAPRREQPSGTPAAAEGARAPRALGSAAIFLVIMAAIVLGAVGVTLNLMNHDKAAQAGDSTAAADSAAAAAAATMAADAAAAAQAPADAPTTAPAAPPPKPAAAAATTLP